MKHPLPIFPIVGPATLEDWVQIDGAWHNVCYVWDSAWPGPVLYVDGKPASIRASFAMFNRALRPAEIAVLYQAGLPRETVTPGATPYHDAILESGGKIFNLGDGDSPSTPEHGGITEYNGLSLTPADRASLFPDEITTPPPKAQK